jgi:hypothetical protein
MRYPAGGGTAPCILLAIVLGIIGVPAGAQAPARIPAGTSGEPLTLAGVRATRGGTVDCPRIRDDAGLLHPVSYLSPEVAVGDRVTVSGRIAVTTACRGPVLVVETERPGGAPARRIPPPPDP